MGQPGDERSDIYSLGVMLYQLILGRLPYDADTPLAVVLKHINEPLPMPQVIKPDLPDDLNRIILKALAKDPDDRYQKVNELTADLRKAAGFSPEDSHPDVAKAGAIKLTGATMVGRVSGGITPLPKAPAQPIGAAAATAAGAAVAGGVATQVASPKTVVASGAGTAATAVSSPATMVATPSGAAATTTVAAPPAKRPGWLIPAIGLAVVAIVAVGAVAILGGRGGAMPTPTVAVVAPPAQPTDTPTPTVAPITTQLLELGQDTDLRDKEGSDPDSQLKGQLPAGTPFFAKARTSDSQWVSIMTQDGLTTGWIDSGDTGLAADQLAQLPIATKLIQPTDTPTPTEEPTDTPTPTATAAPTKPPAPTRPPATKAPTATPTAAAAQEPLGYGFDFKFCTYDGGNYTCNVTVWGSGGDGKYHFALQNPDTQNWDEKTGNFVTYLMRSRRCRTQTQQLRVWDESGNHIEPNLTMDPGAIASLFPGGGCTQ